MMENETRKNCLQLMSSTDIIHLGTIGDDGFPHIRMVGNLRYTRQYPALAEVFAGHDNDFAIFIATSNFSDKIQQIRKNPKACVYFSNPAEIHGLMLAGLIEEITDSKFKNLLWQDCWEMYFPDGPQGKEYAILKLLPAYAKGWHLTDPFEFKLQEKL